MDTCLALSHSAATVAISSTLRKLPELNGLRLIAVSGYGQVTDRIRSREVGFEHHFVKPVDFDALKAQLRRPSS